MKLYVGVSRAGERRLVVARRAAGMAAYELRWQGGAEEFDELAFALLVEHLGEARRARSASSAVARLLAERLSGEFWTLRESELAAALAAAE